MLLTRYKIIGRSIDGPVALCFSGGAISWTTDLFATHITEFWDEDIAHAIRQVLVAHSEKAELENKIGHLQVVTVTTDPYGRRIKPRKGK